MANVIGIWEDALNVQKSLQKNKTILVVVQVHTLCQSDGLRLSVYLYTQFSLKTVFRIFGNINIVYTSALKLKMWKIVLSTVYIRINSLIINRRNKVRI